MSDSREKLFRTFVSEFFNSDREELRKLGYLIERDRFGVTCLDDRITEQIESGNYGETARISWMTYIDKNEELSSSA